MLATLYYYDVYPKVVPTGTKVIINISARSSHLTFDKSEYYVSVLPLSVDIRTKSGDTITPNLCLAKNGIINLGYEFPTEQEYFLRIYDKNDLTTILVQLSIYALDSDLYNRSPLVGDLHLHSCYSDGKEAPEFVAARYREEGFDFIAVTDHFYRQGSLDAIEYFAPYNLSFKLYPGEEVHSPDNHVHFINFGGDYSVNEIAIEDTSKYWERTAKPQWLKEVAEIQATLSDLPEGVDAFVHASSLLVLRYIKKANGLSIFCHPHWVDHVYNVTNEMTKYYLENGFADCFELIGGLECEYNQTQLALYSDIRAKGININIVGNSDSHATVDADCFGEMKTMVFSHSNLRDDIVCAIKDGFSVAIECYKDNNLHVYGNHRLVSYSIFLHKYYLPLHDELCREEGRLMRAVVAGDKNAEKRLLLNNDEIAIFQNKYLKI